MPKPRHYTEPDDGDDNPRFYKMLSKYNGVCIECEQDVVKGELIVYDSVERKVYCDDCGSHLV